MLPMPSIIAVLCRDPARRDRLTRSIETAGLHRAAGFAEPDALMTFLRLSPVTAVLVDAAAADIAATVLARRLRSHPQPASPLFRLVVLSHAAPAFHAGLQAAGFDLVLPAAAEPAALAARIEALLAPAAQQETNNQQYPASDSGTVISLAERRRTMRPA